VIAPPSCPAHERYRDTRSHKPRHAAVHKAPTPNSFPAVITKVFTSNNMVFSWQPLAGLQDPC
jgi:hypothetical protein